MREQQCQTKKQKNHHSSNHLRARLLTEPHSVRIADPGEDLFLQALKNKGTGRYMI